MSICLSAVVLTYNEENRLAECLDSLTWADEIVVVDSYSKKVQHPKGGVVGEILVSEGDRVKAGDVVMRFDATQTRAMIRRCGERGEARRPRSSPGPATC